MPASANDGNVRELLLFIENDGDLYRQQFMPIMKNLARKMLKGNYDSKLAVKLWRYLADAGAQKYTKEFDGRTSTSYGAFSVADRQAVAQELAEAFDRSVANGEWDLKDLAKKEAHEGREAREVQGAEGKILYQNGDFFVINEPKGWFGVYKNGDVYATKVMSIGPAHGSSYGLPRAIAEADKRAEGVGGKKAREGGGLTGVSYLRKGHRVQLHPASDWWMRGARYGEVVSVSDKKNTARVRLDATGKVVTLRSTDIAEVL